MVMDCGKVDYLLGETANLKILICPIIVLWTCGISDVTKV